MRRPVLTALAVLALGLGMNGGAAAQLADKKALTLGEAKKIMAAAQADAAKSNLTMAIAIVDEGGNLLLFEKMDETQTGSVTVAIAKARSAFLFKRPTKVFEDAVQGGRHVILALDGVLPIEGGLPLMAGGKVVGAIGVSGGTAAQDGVVAAAGVAALGK
jgi:glc operon protein GlcG